MTAVAKLSKLNQVPSVTYTSFTQNSQIFKYGGYGKKYNMGVFYFFLGFSVFLLPPGILSHILVSRPMT